MPTISSVTGTVSTGQTLTINGSNLCQDSTTGLHSFLTDATYGAARRLVAGTDGMGLQEASSGNPAYTGVGWTCPGSGAQGTEDTEGAHGFIDTSHYCFGSASAKFRSIENNFPGGNGTGISYNIWLFGGATEYWASWFMSVEIVNGRPSTFNKIFEPNGPGGGCILDWGAPSSTSAYWTGLDYNYPDTSGNSAYHSHTANWNSDGSAVVARRWYYVEAYLKKASGAGVLDGKVGLWIDGRQIVAPTTDLAGGITPTDTAILIGTINAGGATNSSWDFKSWWNCFKMRTSGGRIPPPSLVEISDNSTYGAGTLVRQSPVRLADSSCQVTCDLTGLGAGPYYLFVTDYAQSVSSAYNLSASLTSPSGGFPGLVLL